MKKIGKSLASLLLVATLAGCGTGSPNLSIGNNAQNDVFNAESQYMHWWENVTWTNDDVEFLARCISAEARGEYTAYKKTGNYDIRSSIVGIAYVMARTAAVNRTTIRNLITVKQRYFLSAWLLGNKAGNAENYSQFFCPTSQIANWDELVTIAREALAHKDYTGIDPNHYYDDSIGAPYWATGPGVKKQKMGHFIFIFTNKEA